MKLFARLRRPSPPVDLEAPSALLDPFPVYEKLRSGGPVHYLPRHDFWLVVGHDAVKQAFEHPDLFSSSPYDEIDRILLAADPPRHGPVRRLVSRFFSADALDRLTGVAARTAASLVAPEFDVVEGYGLPISRAVAAALIGFDDEARLQIRHAADQAASRADGLALLIATLDAVAARAALFPELVGEEGGRVNEEAARSLIRLLWLAATTTTERVITRAVLRLVQHGDVRTSVAADRGLILPFIEEVMRLHPPELMVPRRATAPVELGGVTIPAGADVRLCVSAANRDPARFEQPDSLRLDRASRLHFAFGAGIHRCLGAPLTRRVVGAALTELLDAAPDFRPAEPLDGLDYFATVTALAPKRLMIAA